MDTPAYQRLADELRTAIASGHYQPGDNLPKLVELAAQYGISKQTASEALRALEREGLIQVMRRRGTIVLDPTIPRPLLRTREVMRDEIGYYFDPQAQPWRALQPPTRSWRPAPRDIAVLLGMPAGDEVLVRDRVMGDSDSGQAMQLATSYLPAVLARGTVLAEADTGPGGIYDRLEEMGHGPLAWSETITARMPNDDEARLLDVPRGVPLLRVVRVASGADERVVEVNDTRMSAARFAIGYPLGRHASARPAD